MIKKHMLLFCGGSSSADSKIPKPLMKVSDDQTLIKYFLDHVRNNYHHQPQKIYLLCDSDQVPLYRKELKLVGQSSQLEICDCGQPTSTYQKFSWALENICETNTLLHFTYPDIFHSCQNFQEQLNSSPGDVISISAATFSSRFPRLFINPLTNELRGISNYVSPAPANPMYIFAGDLWGQFEVFASLLYQFKSKSNLSAPSLEFDYFFWLINNQRARPTLLKQERFWVDSIRDFERLITTKQGVG